MKKTAAILLAILAFASSAHAQKGPENGYIFPAGGKAGTTVDVLLGGYDWTPDMEFFALDKRVKIVPTGPLSDILIPLPPHWFGAKGRIVAMPVPKEMPARIIIPADVPPGPVYWHAANAAGCTGAGVFIVGNGTEVVEDSKRKTPQLLASLPVTVSGRIIRNEEVDQYRFKATRNGPITCDLMARRLGAKFLGVLEVRDASGAMVADFAGTSGTDPVLTFVARAGAEYVINISDVDFAGDRSFVYRLTISEGPRILGALPLAGKRGETREVEFVGIGVATGSAKLESVKRKITFPASPTSDVFEYRLETPAGTSPPYRLHLSDVPESAAFPRLNPKDAVLTAPCGVTGVLDQAEVEDVYSCAWKAGQVWSLKVEARRFGSPLDVALAIRGPDGKQIVRNEDLPETTDAGLELKVPADGTYQIVVSDTAGKSGSRASIYRLVIRRPSGSDYSLQLGVQRGRVNLGAKLDLPVKVTRKGNFNGPIHVTLQGLPAGITAPADLVIPPGKSDLIISLTAAKDAVPMAAPVTVVGSANFLVLPAVKEQGKGAPFTPARPGPDARPLVSIGAVKGLPMVPKIDPKADPKKKAVPVLVPGPVPVGLGIKKPNPAPGVALKLKGEGKPNVSRIATAPITVNLAPSSPDDNRVSVFFVASAMKALFKGAPVDSDTVRRVHRGSTFPGEIAIERLEGFKGEILLTMAATQSYQVQGITGGEAKVPPGVKNVFYPVFMPEHLESIRTSRCGAIGVVKVPDARGKMRYLACEITGFITMTMEGALLKISAEDQELAVPAGKPFEVHVRVSRLTKLNEPAKLELNLPPELVGKLKAEPVVAAVGQEKVIFRITPTADLRGLQTFAIRATAMQKGIYPTQTGTYSVVSDAEVTVDFLAVGQGPR